ncbi:Schlafen-like protein 1 [Mytilus edulis]|uniref:Schlafen-like protein 1 n=1 Tax=Mytilus edulis TaxID=6550 RepID=A0A8S3SKM0_MYTED|nr:Schlafen-like protein 1 [Mytilus edulis]
MLRSWRKIGSESRNREFKRGGGKYAYDHLKTDVGVYVCAFLNSEEEGTLFIGVNDEGTVEGIECEQRKEDTIRKDIIDPGIKAIKPDIFPKSYTVKFTHVCDKNKWQIGNLKVIEITVKKVEQLTQLYEVFNGDVYIRRDGSKQGPLKVNQIQEWHNQKKKTGLKKDRIKEKEDRIKEKEDRIKEKEERIKEREERIQSLEKQNNEMARAKSRLGHRIDDTEKQMEEKEKILEQKLEEEKKIKEELKEEKEVLEQKMEQEKTTAEQKIRNMEKREKKFKQHISNLKNDIQKFEEQHNTTTADKAALEQRITVNEQEKIELARRAEELENEKMRLEHQIKDTKNEVEKSKNMSSGVDEDRKLLVQHVEDMYLKMKQLEEDIDTTEEEKSRLQQKNDDMEIGKQTNGRQNKKC